jgi:hypothetical protein
LSLAEGNITRFLLDSIGIAVSAEEKAHEQQLQAHRGAIVWWLGRRLTDVSSQLRELKEARLKRELERQRK